MNIQKSILLIAIFVLFLISLIAGRFYYGEVYERTAPKSGSVLEGDQRFYDVTALSISSGRGYSLEGKPTCAYQIGYPVFLGVIYYFFGHNYQAVIMIQIALLLTTFILFGFLAVKINKSLFFIPLLLFVMNYNIVQFAYFLLTETLALFLFVLSAFLFYCFLTRNKKHYLFLLGVVYGCLVLVRPIWQLYPLFMLCFGVFFLTKKNSKTFLNIFGFFLISLIVIIPVFLRNYDKCKSFTLGTFGGYNFFCGTNPNYDGDCPDWKLVAKELSLQTYYEGQAVEPQNEQLLFKKAIENIKKHPVKEVYLFCRNSSRLFFDWKKDHRISFQRTVLGIVNIVSVIFMLAGLWFVVSGRIKLERNIKSFVLVCYSAFFYYSIMSGFFHAEFRYGVYPVVISYLLSVLLFSTGKLKIEE